MNNAPAEIAPTLPSRKIEEPEVQTDNLVDNLVQEPAKEEPVLPPREEPKTLTSAFDDFDLLAAAPRKLFE